VPIELSAAVRGDALARLGEHDLEAARDVEGALEWIAGYEDAEAPLLLSRYDLQVFLWYQLPRKWLIPPEDKRTVAARLGRFLELVGGRAGDYAAICTSADTLRLLKAWEDDDPSAGAMLRDALDASGIEPPDTDVLEWGSVMGTEEARLRDQIAFELERALEDGRLGLGERDFERRQAGFVADRLRRPRAELDGRAAVDLVSEERLARWACRGSDERQALVGAVVPLLREPKPAGAPSPDASAPEPLTWLLDAALDGIALTQTGALNRALVRAAVERFPDWWNAELHGPPHREDDVYSLRELHQLARRLRLLRRRGRKLVLTRRGEMLRRDPAGLFRACASQLIAVEGFDGAAQELAAAVLLSGETVDRDVLESAVHAAIVAEGWNAGGEPPAVYEVAGAAAGLLRLTEALGLIDYDYEYDRESGSARCELTSTAAGREALRLALRLRALRPVRSL
jgi:hypothetical protein